MRDFHDVANASFDDRIAPRESAAAAHDTKAGAASRPALVALPDLPRAEWMDLADHALEPNAYYLPDWACAVSRHADGHRDGKALTAWDPASPHRLNGLMPVTSAWRALRIPLPFLVSYEAYGVLGTPLIRRGCDAAAELIASARATGMRAILLRDVPLDGTATAAIREALAGENLRAVTLRHYVRSALDAAASASRDFAAQPDEASPSRALPKSLRRMRSRLEDNGAVSLSVAREPEDVAAALDTFLALESSGWKGRRGTALASSAGDRAFIREAVPAMAANHNCEIAVLRCGENAVAAGLLLRHLGRAYFFKIGSDEALARYSPGTQLMADVTRHLLDDPSIVDADSTEPSSNGPISRLWPGRMKMADLLIALYPRDPVFTVIHATLQARHAVRGALRPLVTAIRDLRARGTGSPA